jgi:hypothetical protein
MNNPGEPSPGGGGGRDVYVEEVVLFKTGPDLVPGTSFSSLPVGEAKGLGGIFSSSLPVGEA